MCIKGRIQQSLFEGPVRPVYWGGVVRRITRWILVFWVALVAVGCPLLSADSRPEKNILVLYSWSIRGTFSELETLKATVRSRVSTPLNFYVEYLESQRFGSPGYQEALAETLRQTYGGKQIDLVVVAAYPALRFALDHRERLFPGIPIVFITVASNRLPGGVPWPGVMGVTINVDVRGSLDLALRLHPDTQNVALFAGKSEFEQYWMEVLLDELRHRKEKLTRFQLSAISTKQLLAEASKLPSHTIVIFNLIPQESSQPEIGTYDALEVLAQHFPTYCIINYCLGHGAIGGSYTDSKRSAVLGGELAARILSGEKPERISVADDSIAHPVVDWRELHRWKIPESALPPGAIVLYRQPSVWERYERYILAGVAVIILQALLVAGLLWQRARRRSATGALQQLGGHLIHAQDDERARIARELHDDFGQRLAVQCIELTQLGKNLPESEVEERARVSQLLKETKGMSADLRSLSHELHCSRLDLIGLVPTLSGLCEEITQKYKSDVRFTEDEFAVNLTKDVELCLFRVAQEALVNVIKHSEAKSAHVELSASANCLSLRISDGGKGFDTGLKKGAGIGLISMRERLRLVGGRLSVRSEPMRGTEVLAEIPLSALANEGQEITHS